MNLLRPPVRFSERQSFIRPTHLYWSTATHQAPQPLLKRTENSPNASPRPRRFFKSSSCITSSSAKVTSVSRKQDFSKYLQKTTLADSPIARSPLRVPLLMCLRRVSSALRFLLPDCQDQRTVHV